MAYICTMRIAEHIKTLLYRYECVVVPGFGAFLVQRKPAQIHETTNAFYPPKKTVSFNRQLVENDGLLANYIAKVEGIPYEQSLGKIRFFVENLKESLNEHGQTSFNDIGSFYLKGDKTLFQPFLHNNYLLEAFGMASFTSAEISRKETEAEQTEKPKTKVIAMPVETEQTFEEEEEKKRRPAYWKYVAVGVIAIGIAGLVGANWYSSDVKNHNLAAQQQAERQIENKIQQATFVMDTPLPEVTFKITTKRGKYHIVAGAFRVEKNAEKKLHQLKEKGFHAKRIGKNKYGLHTVIYDSFEDRLEALRELRKIKREDNSSAWLLVKKL